MKKTVVLAEKPSVGRDIARILKCHKKGNGFLEGSKYIVTWALGHLVTLADPEMYNDKWKTWRLDDLPMLPEELKLVVIKQSSKQFNIVKSQMNRQDVGEIIIATDAGREGELVARWIIDKARTNKPLKRLWISSVTDKAIRDGFNHLKPGKAYNNLYAAAEARSEADWYVGLNASRALTTKFNAQLSTGRVQTPTLAMVRAREEEINSFQPKTFYSIEAKTTTGMTLTWHDQKNNSRLFSKEKVENIKDKTAGQAAKILHVNKSEKKKQAPQLYDLTALQQDANRIFGFSGKQTLSLMQKLYEQHKVLTYPRTDSRHLSSDIISTLKDRVKAVNIGDYKHVASSLLKKQYSLPKSVVDNNKVSDHHAIIPTEEAPVLNNMNQQERKIYDLVVKRFLAVLSEPYEYEQVTIEAEINQERFSAKGKHVKKTGWKALYQANHEKDEQLPDIQEGAVLNDMRVNLKSGETKPPERLTEGGLLQAMENPAGYMNQTEKHLTQTINNSGGIGTVATRADIIEKLFNSQLLELRGKYIYTTSKGRQLLDLVPEELRSPALTAEWETQLNQIAAGKLNKKQFINEIKDYTKQVVNEIKTSEKNFKHDNMTGSKCPECGKLMMEIDNKKGKMLVCQDRSCGYKKNIFKRTNARCPNCHKRMVLRGEGDGKTFTCQCGFREKLSEFNKRKEQEKNKKVSKKDINQYLKNQDDGFQNNELAEQLSKLKK